jgi:hypothetical protein
LEHGIAGLGLPDLWISVDVVRDVVVVVNAVL